MATIHSTTGTSEHGVLGRRWIYDATRDPVAVAHLLALVRGEVEAQQQDVSDAVDPTVTRGGPAPPDAGQLRVVRVLGDADAEGDDVVGWIAVEPSGGTVRGDRRVEVVRR